METRIPFEGQMKMPKSESNAELPKTVEEIEQELGFFETPEMEAVRKKMIGLSPESDEFGDLYDKYHDLGELVVEGSPTKEPLIGFHLRRAQIKQAAGFADLAMDDYESAVTIADYYNMHKVVYEISVLEKGLDMMAQSWPADVPRH